MGCDIHVYLERKIKGNWHMVKSVWGRAGTDRDYTFFSHLCGVRGGSSDVWPAPKGLPKDVSVVCEFESDVYGVDGHSHSYESLTDFLEKKLAILRIKTATDTWNGSGMNFFTWKILGYDMLADEDYNDYRVVFWFDN